MISIADGDYPAFQPLGVTSYRLGPFEEVEKILYEALVALRLKQPLAPKYYPIILQSGHLTNAQSVGYYSFRCPSLLGSDIPEVNSFADTTVPMLKAIEHLCETSKSPFPIDLTKTCFFSQAGKFNLAGRNSAFPRNELLKHVTIPKDQNQACLYTDSPFLVAGVRLVRA